MASGTWTQRTGLPPQIYVQASVQGADVPHGRILPHFSTKPIEKHWIMRGFVPPANPMPAASRTGPTRQPRPADPAPAEQRGPLPTRRPVGPPTPRRPVGPPTPRRPVGPPTPRRPVGPPTPRRPVGAPTPPAEQQRCPIAVVTYLAPALGPGASAGRCAQRCGPDRPPGEPVCLRRDNWNDFHYLLVRTAAGNGDRFHSQLTGPPARRAPAAAWWP
jgi:hypothetical protein